MKAARNYDYPPPFKQVSGRSNNAGLEVLDAGLEFLHLFKHEPFATEVIQQKGEHVL
jgi:hypothetical protein